jgi:hypothetical protein
MPKPIRCTCTISAPANVVSWPCSYEQSSCCVFVQEPPAARDVQALLYPGGVLRVHLTHFGVCPPQYSSVAVLLFGQCRGGAGCPCVLHTDGSAVSATCRHWVLSASQRRHRIVAIVTVLGISELGVDLRTVVFLFPRCLWSRQTQEASTAQPVLRGQLYDCFVRL